MKSTIPWDLIKKNISNCLSPQEQAALEDWIKQKEINAMLFSEIMSDTVFQNTLTSGKWENADWEWEKFKRKIEPIQTTVIFTKSVFYTVSSIAALLMVVLCISAWLFYNRYKYEENVNTTGKYYVYSPRGQRTHVVLPDKSSVWLNAESSLEYSVSYNRDVREVTLVGEAFFNVTKNPEKPFIVNTTETKVRAYGTTFNVKAYPTDKYIETTLIEGQVGIKTKNKFGKKSDEIFLRPKEKFRYEKYSVTEIKEEKPNNKPLVKSKQKTVLDTVVNSCRTKILVIKEKNTDSESLWKDGNLIFNNETFEDLAIKMERWFDVKIHFSDENLKTFRFTGQFKKETINQALDALALSSQNACKYSMEFRDVYITLDNKANISK